jgi:hypothetical protein
MGLSDWLTGMDGPESSPRHETAPAKTRKINRIKSRTMIQAPFYAFDPRGTSVSITQVRQVPAL